MDLMDVYTPYTLLFMAAALFGIMSIASSTAYFFVRVRLRPLFWAYLAVQGSLLFLLAGKVMERVSPEAHVLLFSLAVQTAGFVLLVLSCLFFAAVFSRRSAAQNPMLRHLAACFLVVAAAGATFSAAPRWLNDYAPILAAVLWCVYTAADRKSFFVELSQISVDAFMEQTEDAILIFDRSEQIMDCNGSAKCLFPFLRPKSSLAQFMSGLRSAMAGEAGAAARTPDLSEPVEISFPCEEGMRYFLATKTFLERKPGEKTATILTFHNVTEKTLLLRELAAKNELLEKLNRELVRSISVSHALEDEEAKNRAVMELQRTLGQSIAELLLGLEALSVTEQSDEAVKRKLSELIEACRSIMSEIRKSVEKLTSRIGEEDLDE